MRLFAERIKEIYLNYIEVKITDDNKYKLLQWTRYTTQHFYVPTNN